VLKKILNRFRTVSSDWLILGVGSMYRGEKQSQTPTLFDSIDETVTKPSTLMSNIVEKNTSSPTVIQQKTIPVQEVPVQTPPEISHTPLMSVVEQASAAKSVRKIIIYYTDNTFQEFK
jgi:hypothetical protein